MIVETGRNPDPPEVNQAKRAAIEQRREIEEKILGNLLRLNLERAES